MAEAGQISAPSTRTIGATWPKVVGELARQAEELGELLGEDHDLAVLGSTLASPPAVDSLDQSGDELTTLVDGQRKTFQLEAISKASSCIAIAPNNSCTAWKPIGEDGSRNPAQSGSKLCHRSV